MKQTLLRARHTAFNHKDIILRADIQYGHIFLRNHIGAHVPGKLLALYYPAWPGAAPNGTRSPVEHGTVSHSAALKTIPANNTLKTAPLNLTTNINNVTNLEEVGYVKLLPHFILARIGNTEFPDVIKTALTGKLYMTGLGFIQSGFLFSPKSDLDGIIAFFSNSLFLKHYTGTGLNHRYRDSRTVLGINPGHTKLLSH